MQQRSRTAHRAASVRSTFQTFSVTFPRLWTEVSIVGGLFHADFRNMKNQSCSNSFLNYLIL